MDQDATGDGSPLALDAFGNATGGIRNVWVDVPMATYGVMGKGKTTATDRLCLLAGTKSPLPDATLRMLYPSRAQYATRVDERLRQLIAEGWFLPEYADRVRADAQAAAIPRRDLPPPSSARPAFFFRRHTARFGPAAAAVFRLFFSIISL